MRNTTKNHRLVVGLALPLALALAACGQKDDDDGDSKKPADVTNPGTGTGVDPGTSSEVLGPCLTAPDVTLRLTSFASGALERDQRLVEAALKAGTPEGFTVRVAQAYRNGAGADASHFDLVQEFAGLPLCGFRPRAHVVRGDAQVPFLPAFTAPASTGDAAFGAAQAALELAAQSMGAAPGDAIIRKSERCFAPSAGELVPAWDILASIAGEPFRVIGSSARTLTVEAQSLHAAGTATIYKRNNKDALSDVAISTADDGSFDFERLRLVDRAGAVSPLRTVGGKIAPAVDSADFLEVSLFAHAQEHLTYGQQFRNLGDGDCSPIEIEAHASTGPVYRPSWNQASGHPRILVPDQLSGSLINLATDYDAIAHEMGHHFVYQRLKSLSYEPSLVIHEGLADFFVYAHTGDTCLAETICPADTTSTLCVSRGQCLREGDVAKSKMMFHNDLYESTSTPVHKKSQALSGLLVAIGKEPTVGADVIAKIMFAGIDFLKEKSELADFLEAVLQGDKTTFAGAHACTILAKAKEFGLTDEAAGKDCAAYQK